jgi:hypothetical protein
MAGGALLSQPAAHCKFFLGKTLYKVHARSILRVQKESGFPHKANRSFPIADNQ